MVQIVAPQSRFEQIAEVLRERIEAGTYAAGSLLPSEPELSTEFRVSRVTVNRAVGLLRQAGLVKVQRGRGTRVRSIPRIRRDARRRYAAREQGTGAYDVEVRQLGLHPHHTVEVAEVVPPPDVCALLGLKPKQKALLRRRRFFASDEPTEIADSYIPLALAKAAGLDSADTGIGGSYSRLADAGHAPTRFTEDVECRPATDDEAVLLDLDAGQPVIQITHIAHDASDAAVSVTMLVMTGHLWRLHYEWEADAGNG